MESTEFNSKALRQAALRSDRIRIIAILIVLCLLFVFTVARRLVLEGIDGTRGLAIFASFFGAMIAYEVATLRRVTRALREGTEPDPARWISNVVVEALFPTIGLGVLIAMGMTRPYAALVAPVVLTYFLFISLSTLRLSPTLTRLSGLCSAVGYSAVAIYVFTHYPTPDMGTGMYPIEFYVGNIVVILVAGFVAGEVARQIRGHVSAALREAREVERITGRARNRAHHPARAAAERGTAARRLRRGRLESAGGPDRRRLLRVAGPSRWTRGVHARGRHWTRHRRGPRGGDVSCLHPRWHGRAVRSGRDSGPTEPTPL